MASYAADASPEEEDWRSVGPSHLYWADFDEVGTHAVAVRPCTAPGLCAAAADATTAFVQVRAEPPTVGTVDLALSGGGYLSSPTGLSGTWSGFTGAAKIEMCVGTTPMGCQAAPFSAVDPVSWADADVGGLLAAPNDVRLHCCLLYTSPSPRDKRQSRMPSSA